MICVALVKIFANMVDVEDRAFNHFNIKYRCASYLCTAHMPRNPVPTAAEQSGFGGQGRAAVTNCPNPLGVPRVQRITLQDKFCNLQNCA